MAALLVPLSVQTIFDNSGEIAAGAKIYIYQSGTTTPKASYSDSGLTVTHSHPVLCSALGRVPVIYVGTGSYKVRITTADDELVDELDGLPGAVEDDDDDDGGDTGGGLETGDVIWSPRTGSRDGYVPLNGRTIGSASSGATGRANADCEDLFTFYWQNFSNSLAPVSGGRGSSAAGDWTANKTIQLLDARGRSLIGLDDMGAGAANRVQVSTTIDTTAGSASATVASASGLAKGMTVVSANVPSGTTISDIAGTTLTLSANASATAAGVAARFSFIADPQVAGSSGGSATVTLTTSEMPVHGHDGTTGAPTEHAHTYQEAGDTQYVLPGTPTDTAVAGTKGSATTGGESAHTHDFTTDDAGGGLPASNLPPALVGTWYQKL